MPLGVAGSEEMMAVVTMARRDGAMEMTNKAVVIRKKARRW